MSLAADKARMEQKEREIRAQKEEEERKQREAEEQKIQLVILYRPFFCSFKSLTLNHSFQLVRRFRKTERLSVLIKYLGAKGYSVDGFRLFNSDFPKKDVSTFDELKSFADLKWPVFIVSIIYNTVGFILMSYNQLSCKRINTISLRTRAIEISVRETVTKSELIFFKY
uniref:UBX domain-containing protein n=1 Tax=Heterorhabditis bacteriophora TaxID=37862 RepID=A0A1I7WW64_HETBA